MSEPTIFVCKPKSISSPDKAKLSKAGVIVIEMDNPNDFKLVRAGLSLDSSDTLGVALKALNFSNGSSAADQREEFTKLFCVLVNAGLNK